MKALIIGSGAGGAMAAKMLARDFDVTVLDEEKDADKAIDRLFEALSK